MWGEGAIAQQSASASLATSVWDLFFGMVAPVVEPGPENSEVPVSGRLEQVSSSSVALGTSHTHEQASASRFVLSSLCTLSFLHKLVYSGNMNNNVHSVQ